MAPSRQRNDQEMKKFAFIRLMSGDWTSASTEIVSPFTVELFTQIPDHLDYRLVDPATISTWPKWTLLLKSLGMKTLSEQNVQKCILSRYRRGIGEKLTVNELVENVKFFFKTRHAIGVDSAITISDLPLVVTGLHWTRPSQADIYLGSNEPFSASSMFSPTEAADLRVYFAHPRYTSPMFLEEPPVQASALVEWYYETLGLRRHIRLVHRDGQSLSEEARHIAKTRHANFLPFLQVAWENTPGIEKKPNVHAALRQLEVVCRKPDLSRPTPLGGGYLPLQNLQKICKRYIEVESFPFLDIQMPDEGQEWSFLSRYLGVGCQDDLQFSLHILEHAIQPHGYSWKRFIPPIRNSQLLNLKMAKLFVYINSKVSSLDGHPSKNPLIRHHFFGGKALINDKGVWKTREQCVWNAEVQLVSKFSLRRHWETVAAVPPHLLHPLQHFFQTCLLIPDASVQHYLDDLVEIKGLPEEEHVPSVIEAHYSQLFKFASTDAKAAIAIRARFSEERLVYFAMDSGANWIPPSACVWSGSASVAGRARLDMRYKGLEEFFTRILRVPNVDASMIYSDIRAIGASVPLLPQHVEQVKRLLLALGSVLGQDHLDPITHSASALLDEKVLPIRRPKITPSVSLESACNDFVIVDREGSYAKLGKTIPHLAFEMSEISRLRPFIAWAGLEQRYLSSCVTECSKVPEGSGVEMKDHARLVKLKAHGILRVAAMFGSERYNEDRQRLYDLLHDCTTLTSDDISSTLRLTVGGTVHEMDVGKGDLHIEESDRGLRIFLPTNEDDREDCFSCQLPRRLLMWMLFRPGGGDVANKLPDGAVNALAAILTRSPTSTRRILEKLGVPPIDVVDRGGEHDALVEGPSQPDDDSTLPSSRRTAGPDGLGLTIRTLGIAHGLQTTPLSRVVVDPAREAEERKQYGLFLELVVTMARHSVVPHAGETNLKANFSKLDVGDGMKTGSVSIRSGDDLEERLVKIGAAGELFVFELLSKLDSLPGFARENWKSCIRHRVCQHPEYRNLTRFDGYETADMVYADSSGAFTNFLIQRGYLDQTWEGEKPEYLIEVKSTIKSCDEKFHVSQNQYKLMMQHTQARPGGSTKKAVYIVFRVFNLGSMLMGLKIYVDPEMCRWERSLSFEAEHYEVWQNNQ